MKNGSILFSLLLLVTAQGVRGQDIPTFTDEASYAAWKQQFIAPPGDVPDHPTEDAPDEGPELRGGSATCDCWVTPDASYTTINNNSQWNASGWSSTDDGSYGPITLPFTFYLYGQNWTTAYININGNISFGNYFSTYSSTGFPISGYTMVGPFWADVDLGGFGAANNKVQYKITPTALYVNWTNVGYFPSQTDKLNTFQVIITDGTDPAVPNGANVSFCYEDMQWTTGSASGGSNGFGGTAASVGANHGNGVDYIQFGRFDHAGTDYDGPFGGADGVSWLDDKYFTFSTSVTTGNVPPVVTGQSVCDSITVCTDQLTQLSVDFLSPEPTQITSAISSCTTLSSYTVISSDPGLTAHIVTEFTPTMADTGYHIVTFEGTDDGTPVMTSVLTIVLHVLPSPQLISGSLSVCDNGTPLNMLTVLGGTPTPGGSWVAPDGAAHDSLFNPGEDMDGGYVYSVGMGTICSATGTATITNIPHADAGGDTTLAYCSWDYPDALFPRLTGSPQTGGAWLAPNGLAFDGMLDPSTFEPGIYQYVVTPTVPCLNDTSRITVAIPQAVHAGTDSTIVMCRDASPFSMRSKLAGTVDTTGTWADVNGATVPDLFDPATGVIGVYTYTVPAVLPCPFQSAVLTVNLDVLPVAGLDSALVICANGGNTPLFPLIGGGPDVGGHWLDPLGTAMDGVLDPSLELSGIYGYIVFGPGTCVHLTDTALVDVHIDPLAVITFTADPDSGCNPLEVQFLNTTASIYVGGSCIWDVGDGSAPISECGTFTHTYANAGWYHVKLKMTTPEDCTSELIAPGAVLVDPKPVANFIWTPDPGTAETPELVFTATDPHAIDFQWTFPNGVYQQGEQVAFTFPDEITAEYPVCLSVLDRYGCADTLCQIVPVLIPNLWAPLAFTPDGNGVNDTFRPVTTDMAEDDYHLLIFDRWGELLFETRSTTQGWDGRGKNGSILPTGAYVWRLIYRPIYTSDKVDRFGVVDLLK